MSPLDVERAAALPGPDWLRERRQAAAEKTAGAPLPSPDEEVWRYSRVGDLDLEEFELVTDPDREAAVAGTRPTLDLVPERAASVVLGDGHLIDVAVADRWAEAGVEVTPVGDLEDGAGLLGSVATEPTDLFAELNDAFCASPLVIRVPDGVVVSEPLVVAHWTGQERGASFPRLVVQLGRDAEATVVSLEASGNVPAFTAPIVELAADTDSRLRYLGVQAQGPRVWHVASQVSRVDQNADLVAAHAALGGDYARLRSDCRLSGRGASGTLLSVYFGEGDQMLDLRTFQDHAAPDTTSELLFKGAVGDRSQSVYTGLIRVRPEARGTDARQTNRIVKLSEDAWAESVPNLEIENNDVHCAHASAVGPVDEDQHFYLQSRGIPPRVAERLVVTGFFEEVVERFPVQGVADDVRHRLEARLTEVQETS